MIRTFECFCGYGGASWGLKLANIEYELIGFSEIKKAAIKCFTTNFPNAKNYGDITNINWKEVPDFDLLTGGFPCQDVSNQGKRDLTIGRTMLVYNLIEALEIKQPKWFLFENVGAIEQEQYKDFLFEVEKEFRKKGYQVFRKLLKSCEHGSPQARERVFFIGFRKDLAKPFGFNPYPVPSTEIRVVNDILENPGEINNKKNKIVHLGKWKPTEFNSRNRLIAINGFWPTLVCVDEKTKYELNGVTYSPTEKELFRLQGFFEDEIDIHNLTYAEAVDLSGDGWDVNLVKQIFANMELV